MIGFHQTFSSDPLMQGETAAVQPSLPLPVQVSQMRYSVGFPASRDVLDDDERL